MLTTKAVRREYFAETIMQYTQNLAGFRLQSQLLAKVFELVQTGNVSVPLFDPVLVPDPDITNLEFLEDYCLNLIQNTFPDLRTYALPFVKRYFSLKYPFLTIDLKRGHCLRPYSNIITIFRASSQPCETSLFN